MSDHDGFICPVCGSDVPPRAAACPACGSDEKTGWSDDTIYDGTGIEDPADFDYDEYVAREFGDGAHPAHRRWGGWLPVITAIILLIFVLVWVLS